MADIPLVLFSGGLDSTYLVSTLLMNGPVDVLYVNGGQHSEKIKKEIEARDKLIALMNQIYPYKIQGQYEILDTVYKHDGENKKWIQPNAWMQGAYRVLKPGRHGSVKIAYVRDDGAAFGRKLPTMETQWEATLSLGYAGDHVPLEFPVIHMSKLEILEEIDKRLLEHIWVCEKPENGKSCGKCVPCDTIDTALYRYKKKHGETVWRTAKRAIRGFNAEDKIKKRENTHVSYHCHDSDFYEYLKGEPGWKPDPEVLKIVELCKSS